MIIYKATNKINNKVYIGQTIRPLHERIYDHIYEAYHGNKMLIAKAIRKYGEDNFYWEVIDKANSQQELDKKEKYWIKFYRATDRRFGYNISFGGNDGRRSTDFGRRLAKIKGTKPFYVYKTNGEYVGIWYNKRECERDLGMKFGVIGKMNKQGWYCVNGYIFIDKHKMPQNHEELFDLIHNINKKQCCKSAVYKWDSIEVYCRYTGKLIGVYDNYIECAKALGVNNSVILQFLSGNEHSGKWIIKRGSNNIKIEFETKPLYYLYDAQNGDFLGIYKTIQEIADETGLSQQAIHAQLNKTKVTKNKRYIITSQTKKIII